MKRLMSVYKITWILLNMVGAHSNHKVFWGGFGGIKIDQYSLEKSDKK